MARNSIHSLPSVFLIFLSIFSLKAASFSVDLFHRDFLHFTPSNSSYTFERIRAALQRSHHRVKLHHHHHHHHHPHQLVPGVEISPIGGAYVMKFSLGIPPVKTAAIVDTGSDLTWIQCMPCIECFKQDHPIFEPRNSSSYRPVSCDSNVCRQSDLTTSCHGSSCGYELQYGDGSYSRGDVITETLTLGTAKIRNIVMGCGHENQGTFGHGTSGIVGLGGGKTSLVSQLAPKIQYKFSYCLTPFPGILNPNPSSKLHFGKDAVVAGPGVVSTPFILAKLFYLLTLEAITVGGSRRLNYLPRSFESDSERGNIIIDSGTTLTYLSDGLYLKVRRAMKSLTKLPETRGPLDLCFRVAARDEEFPFPLMTMHFKGADVELKGENIYIRVSEESVCLAFMPTYEDIGIYGNIQQANFLVGYDLKKKTVSFKHTDCVGK